jgi:hypothetical protein
MRRLLTTASLLLVFGLSSSLARADGGGADQGPVLVGLIEYDSNGPINSFFVTNLTDAGLDPGVATDLNFTNLTFTTTDLMGNSSGAGTSIGDIPSMGNSADVFDSIADDLVSATISGSFDVTSVTLSDGTQVTIDPNFTATIFPSCGPTLVPDCDFASISAEITQSTVAPEPGTLLLITSALPLFALLRRRNRKA